MRLGQVVGTVVATQKNENLVGRKLLVVQEMEVDGSLRDSFLIAVDSVGAGKGDIVLTVAGSSARLTPATKDAPVDTAIMAIVDTVEVRGELTYQKGA